MKLHMHILGPQAIWFVHESLQESCALTGCMRRFLLPQHGRAFACLPANLDNESVSDPNQMLCVDGTDEVIARRRGAVAPRPPGEEVFDWCRRVVVRSVADWISACANRACLVEEASFAAATGPTTTGVVRCGSEIYYRLAGVGSDERSVRDAFRFSTRWRFLAALAEVGGRCELLEKTDWRLADIEYLSQHVCALILEAYDRDAYLLWESNHAPEPTLLSLSIIQAQRAEQEMSAS